MSVFKYEKDSDGIVTVTMDMDGPVNSMSAAFKPALGETLSKLESETDLRGVVFASAKETFFAGGDLKSLLAVKKEDAQQTFEGTEAIKADLRRIEKLPVPVVAAINGAALGGGFEICLSCNYRVAFDHKSVQIGFPEVSLGLLPGGGGIVRAVNLLGLQPALPYLMEGKKVDPAAALKAGLIHETVDSLDQLLSRAKAYINENKGNDLAAVQPWDQKGFKIPGGSIVSPKLAGVVAGATAMLVKATRGLLPAPAEILDCAVEAARLDFDTAMRVESRGFARLVVSPQAKNMINTFFFQMNKVNGGASRPVGVEKSLTKRVGVLGAGMMGQGIAYSSAMAGIEVVLKDISLEAAEKGKAYTERLLDKRVAKGRMSEEKKAEVLGRIKASADDKDLEGCDLIIEAVFEDVKLKQMITESTEKYLSEGGVWGSNTSSLPITELAKASKKPENFVGIHFFSPVDKMPLVEIICGEKTSDATLAKAFDYARQLKKTPIVVNDSPAFFTSRTFGSYLDEGARLVTEGAHPIQIDNLGRAIGMPVGPLTVHDEVSQQLTLKAHETWEAMGKPDALGKDRVDMQVVLQKLVVENGRGGRYHGGGYFDYGDNGGKSIWPGLMDAFYKSDVEIPQDDIKDRLLFRQVIESLKCLEEGVLRSVADGNIGSIMGIGAPVWTGGYLQFINTYGLERFQARCDELAERYGERFACPALVMEKIKSGETFQ